MRAQDFGPALFLYLSLVRYDIFIAQGLGWDDLHLTPKSYEAWCQQLKCLINGYI